jgi:hypothetical protein
MIAIEVDAVFDGERYLPDGAVVIVDGRHVLDVNPSGTPPRCRCHSAP